MSRGRSTAVIFLYILLLLLLLFLPILLLVVLLVATLCTHRCSPPPPRPPTPHSQSSALEKELACCLQPWKLMRAGCLTCIHSNHGMKTGLSHSLQGEEEAAFISVMRACWLSTRAEAVRGQHIRLSLVLSPLTDDCKCQNITSPTRQTVELKFILKYIFCVTR